MTKRLILPLFLIAAALALAACGSSESDEDKITETIQTSATANDPADCKALNTVAFNEQTAGGSGPEAVKACEDEAEDDVGDPEEVEVSEVEVDGSDATAVATFVGGSFDGQEVEVALIEEDGDWKMDQLVRFVDFDAAAIVSGLRESLEEDDGVPERPGQLPGRGIRRPLRLRTGKRRHQQRRRRLPRARPGMRIAA